MPKEVLLKEKHDSWGCCGSLDLIAAKRHRQATVKDGVVAEVRPWRCRSAKTMRSKPSSATPACRLGPSITSTSLGAELALPGVQE